MFYQVGNSLTASERDAPHQVEVVTLNLNDVARHGCRRSEASKLDTFNIGQLIQCRDGLIILGLHRDDAYFWAVLGDGYADFAWYAGLNHLVVSYS